MNSDTISKYTKCAIVYVDILGSTNSIKNDKNGDSVLIMKKAIKEAEKFTKVNLNEVLKHSSPKYKFFSDNIIFAIDLEYEVNDYFLLGVVVNFIEKVTTECGWLCRGAFTYGDIYIDEDFVWGPGLVRSYELENQIAIYPRIIIDPEFESALVDRNPETKNLIFKKDEDGLYFLDIISYIMNSNDKIDTIFKLKNICLNILESHKKDIKISQKINWFSNYINSVEESID